MNAHDKPPGYDLMTSKEQTKYDAHVSAGKNFLFSTKKRQMHRHNAASKLKRVIEERMSATELATLESVKQAAVERRQQQILYGVSLLSGKQKLAYDGWIAEAKRPATTKTRRNTCNGHAVEMADNAVKKKAETEKLAAMTPEELQEYMESDGVVAKREKTTAKGKKRHDKEAAADVIRHACMNAVELEEERVKKAAYVKIHGGKYRQKQKELRGSGDKLAIARQNAKIEKNNAMVRLKSAKEKADIAKFYREKGILSTAFGEEGVEREEAISQEVEKIMGNYAGVAHPLGTATSNKWVDDHGDISVRDKLAQGGYAAYILITRTDIFPGKEKRCRETRNFITELTRNPPWRIEQEDGDLKRMSLKEAKSVIKPYILAYCKTPYDITSLEAACQLYLEDVIGMPHGLSLHKRVGAGNRLKDSMTKSELKIFLRGGSCRYSLAISMIRVTDCVFAEMDTDDVERVSPLISASVAANDGTDTVYRIRVGGKGQPFPATPSVVEDKATMKARRANTKARRSERKRKADGPTSEADASEGCKRKR
jgi:hypothetical protein